MLVCLQISHSIKKQMDDLFGRMNGRLRISITDSTMMRIVHCAMNKAHEKVKSKEGVIERLNEISKFYELAVMQLEGCMKFVQEESESYILESSHGEEILAGLAEIRNRLQGRLNESEMAITEKDRELKERLEKELKLRQTLELKERELVTLRAKLEKTESKDVEDREGEFCELKNSVDQQVWNIRQKLEPDYDRLRDQGGINNEKVEQMGSDIDILKETLDVAFGKMRNAISLSEVAPVEQQWRWGIEKDTFCVLLRGLMWDFQDMLEEKMWREETRVPIGFRELWPSLVNEVAGLKSALSSLFDQHEAMQAKNDDSIQEKNLKEGVLLGEDSEEDGNHYVAKMIKSHELIIRKKSAEAEELNLLRREIAREKAFLSCRRDKEPVCVKKRVQEVIVKLGNLMEWSDKLGEHFDDHREESLSSKSLLKSDATNRENQDINTLEDAWKSMAKVSCEVNEELPNKAWRLEQEVEEINLKTMIMEEDYRILLEGLSKETNNKLYSYELEKLQWEGKCMDLVVEMTNQSNVESQIREEIFCIVFNEAIKDCCSFFNSRSTEFNDVREDIDTLVFSEMLKEWNKSVEDYDIDVLVREEIRLIVYAEIIKSIVDTASFMLKKYEEDKLAEDSVKEDLCKVIIGETMKEWKMNLDAHNVDSLLREEIYQFVIFEAAKGACVAFKKGNEYNQEKPLGCLFCDGKLKESKLLSTEESMIQMIDPLPECLEEEEHLILSPSSDIRRRDSGLALVGLGEENLGRKATSDSFSFNLEKDVQQFATSKDTSGKIVSSLGLVLSNPDKFHQGIPTMKRNGERQLESFDSLVGPIRGFSQQMADFECRVTEELEMNSLRLEQIKHHFNPLLEIFSSVHKKESLYRKAFIRRCQNLKKAETEVDLLGDQVEVLLGLLQKIYTTLHHYSSALQQYIEVPELLQLIKNELSRVINTPKD